MSTAQYAALLAGVRPRDPVGSTRRRLAAAEVADRQRLDTPLKDLTAKPGSTAVRGG